MRYYVMPAPLPFNAFNSFTPWEASTHVPEAAQPGLLPQAATGSLTALFSLLIILLLWPLYGAWSLGIGLTFGRLMALDLTTYTLPNVYTIPLLTVGVLHALTTEHLTQAALAIVLIFVFNRTLMKANLRAARKIGVGGGDLKLLASLFAFLPLTSACWAIAAGCILYMPVAFLKPKATVPFGVPLILGWILLLRVPHLPNWLFSTIS